MAYLIGFGTYYYCFAKKFISLIDESEEIVASTDSIMSDLKVMVGDSTTDFINHSIDYYP